MRAANARRQHQVIAHASNTGAAPLEGYIATTLCEYRARCFHCSLSRPSGSKAVIGFFPKDKQGWEEVRLTGGSVRWQRGQVGLNRVVFEAGWRLTKWSTCRVGEGWGRAGGAIRSRA